MKKISIIVAASENNAIGKDNQLLWHLPEDLKFFKRTTSGHPVIMGRKTFESVGKPLPNRRNIIVSRQADLQITGTETFTSIEDALQSCKNEKEVFIVGGAEIYELSLPFVNKLYLTKVHHTFEADTFFKEPDLSDWILLSSEDHYKDEKHAYDFTFLILEKK